MSSESDNDLHFENDTDNINISLDDNTKEQNNFILRRDNNLNNNEDINIRPTLRKMDNISYEKPSLSSKSVPMDNIDLLINSKRVNNSDKNIDKYNSDKSNSEDEKDNYDNDSDSEDDIMKSNNTDNNFNINNNYSSQDYISDDDDDDNSIKKEDEEDEDEDEEEEEEELSYEQIQKIKADIIYKLNRLEKIGYKASRRYSMASNLEDLKFEYNTLKRQRGIEKSVKFSRKMLMAFVSGVEFLNNKFDYFNLKLDHWSEHTMENINDYDEVFEELHDKHQESFEMAPELRLLMMVGGSGFMYHLQQSLFQSATPEISDILRQNPDIMRSVTQAAAGNMAKNIAKEENDPESEPILNMMMGGNGNRSRRQMAEPSGVDDILEELGKNTSKNRHDDEISTKNIEFSSKKSKKPRRGIQLDI